MSPIEIIGVLVSALAIALTAKRKMACWPVGLVSVALYGWIFYDAKLYSDMLLQGAFAVMQVYGWWRWFSPAPSGAPVRVLPASWRRLAPGLVAGAIGSVVLGGIMDHFTDAALPWVDATLSAFSLVAQYWTARKYIASWSLWTVVDCVYVGMFVFKDLYPTALLYAFFVFLAVTGWRDWRNTLREQQRADAGTSDEPTAAMINATGGLTLAGEMAGMAGLSGISGMSRVAGIPEMSGVSATSGASSATAFASGAEPLHGAGQNAAPLSSRDPIQFGVSGEQNERDWPLMIESEVAGVLASYPVSGSIAQLSWHSPRPFAAAALVTMTTGEMLFIKRHHVSLRDIAALAEEHHFIAHLAAQKVPVTTVLPDRLGRTAVAIGEWTYEVHLAADGDDIYRNVMSWEPFQSGTHAYAAGLALARLHAAARSYQAPARPTRLLLSSFQVIGKPDLMAALEAWVHRQPLLEKALGQRPWRDDIQDVIGPHHARLVPLLPTLEPLWTHGDWHASNLLWHLPQPAEDDRSGSPTAEVRSVLDFGLADKTCAMMDLALAIERSMIEWLVEPPRRQVHRDHIDALLDGYAAIRPLSRADYRALVALLPIVHTEFALSEVAYFAGVLDLAKEAAVAYDDYLLGHVRWFEQPQGAMLLAHLHSRGAQLQQPTGEER